MTYYSILIEITLPDLYNPPNGTPPAAAAVSSAKFNDSETWVKIINPSAALPWVILPEIFKLLTKVVQLAVEVISAPIINEQVWLLILLFFPPKIPENAPELVLLTPPTITLPHSPLKVFIKFLEPPPI